MLIGYGNLNVKPDWHVSEQVPPGFSRVYYVYSGEVTYQDEFCTKRLKSGWLYIFPSSAPFTMVHNVEDPLCCTYLHIDVFPILISRLIEIDLQSEPMLSHLIPAIACAIDQGNAKIVSSLSDAVETFLQETKRIVPPVLEISNIILYIAEHLGQNITIEELSQLSGYHPQYFIRLFKKSVGISPHQYILNYRFSEAVKLLRKDYTVGQVAEMTGFSDGKAFSRAFHNKFGLSPSKFRKIYTYMP